MGQNLSSFYKEENIIYIKSNYQPVNLICYEKNVLNKIRSNGLWKFDQNDLEKFVEIKEEDFNFENRN